MLYVASNAAKAMCKVGVTSDINARLNLLNHQSKGTALRRVWQLRPMSMIEAIYIEKGAHAALRRRHALVSANGRGYYGREWYRCTPLQAVRHVGRYMDNDCPTSEQLADLCRRRHIQPLPFDDGHEFPRRTWLDMLEKVS
jgi:hypothetical protein